MPAKSLHKRNCVFLYGDDLVSMSLRKDGLLNVYFQGNPPDATEFDGVGTFQDYTNALEGQSLFSAETAVVIHNPPFLKRISTSGKADKAQTAFLEALAQLPPEIFCVILVDGKVDKRLKLVKDLLSICYSEEMSLLKPQDGAGVMTRLLMDAGKRVEPQARAYLTDVLSSWEEISRPLLQTECDKIVLMCGESAVVTKRILELALPDYMNQGVFKFVDAVIAKDAHRVLEGADKVFTDTSTTIKNLGFLSYKFRQIKLLKEMQRARVPLPRMQKTLSIRGDWAWKNLLRDARHVTEEDAEWMLLHIFRYQYHTRQDGAELELRDMLLRYCMR